MKISNLDNFDPYHKWLGIPKNKQPPNHYELLGISLNEDDPEVIQSVAEQRKQYVESKRGQGMDDAVASINFKIDEAKLTLLSPEMRRDYDQRLQLFDKRSRNRQFDSVGGSSPRKSGSRKMAVRGPRRGRNRSGLIKWVVIALGVLIVAKFWQPWEALLSNSSISTSETPFVEEPKGVGEPTMRPVTSTVPPAVGQSGNATVASPFSGSVNEIETPADDDVVAVAIKPVISIPAADANSSGSPPASASQPVALPKPVYELTFDEKRKPKNTTVGKVRMMPARVGKGVNFNGSNHVILPANVPQGKQPRTVSAWLRNLGPSPNRNMHVIAYGVNAGTSRPFGIMHNNELWACYGWLNERTTDAKVDREWHHHCVSYDGKNLVYRFDGQVVAEVEGELDTSGDVITLGTYASPLGPENSFTGQIDEVQVYDVSLNDAQVKQLYQSYEELPAEE